MDPITFNATAVTLEDRPDHYAVIRRWYRDADVVHEQAFRLPKDAGAAIMTTRGLVARAQLLVQHEVTDNDDETAVAVVFTLGGELVRRDAHVIKKRMGLEAAAVAAAIG